MENVENDDGDINHEMEDGAGAAVPILNGTTMFSLLPKEMWDGILSYLGPTEFYSLINACSWLDQEFHEQKTNKLFPLVSCVLLSYLPMRTALCLRRVNKATRATIDDEITRVAFASPSKLSISSAITPFGCQNRGKSSKVQELIKKLEGRYTWSTTPGENGQLDLRFNVLNFVARFNLLVDLEVRRQTSHSPFLIREIHLKGSIGLLGEHFTLQDLLDDYGHYLWSLVHESSNTLFTENDGRALITLLNSLPNLKILKLSSNVVYIESCRIGPEGCACGCRKYFVLAPNFLEHYRYGTRLEALICSGSLLESNQEVLRLPNYLPNISRLRIGPVFCRRSFLMLAQINWSLQELQIHNKGGNYTSRSKFKISDFVTVIDNFSDTLVGLELFVQLGYLNLEIDWDEMEIEKKRGLVKLKKFSTDLIYVKGGWLWAFIHAKFPNLEELMMRAYPNFSFRDRGEVACGFEVLPRLKSIVVEVYRPNRSVTKFIMKREEFTTLGK